MENLTGKTIKDYTILEQVGKGAQAVVYKAMRLDPPQIVAIKFLHPKYAEDPRFVERFRAEAGVIARLNHPHIVPVYHYWHGEEGTYIILKWMNGGTLRDVLNKYGKLQPAQVAYMLAQLSDALGAAHRKGVIHRDLKPANILFDDDHKAYIADFGIAKRMDIDITQTGAVMGTPAYLAPEQLLSQPVTPQTDIYVLGINVWEMLIGRHPFAGLKLSQMMAKQLKEHLPPLHEVNPALSPALDAVVQRATSKPAHDRFPNVETFAQEFRKAMND